MAENRVRWAAAGDASSPDDTWDFVNWQKNFVFVDLAEMDRLDWVVIKGQDQGDKTGPLGRKHETPEETARRQASDPWCRQPVSGPDEPKADTTGEDIARALERMR